MSSGILDRLWPTGTPQGVKKRLKRSGKNVIYAFSIKFSTKIRIKFEKQEKNEKKAPTTAPESGFGRLSKARERYFVAPQRRKNSLAAEEYAVLDATTVDKEIADAGPRDYDDADEIEPCHLRRRLHGHIPCAGGYAHASYRCEGK